MKTLFLLLLFFFCSFLTICNAQYDHPEGITVYSGNNKYHGESYKKEELEHIIKKDSEAYPIYKKYKNKRKISRIAGFTSLGILGSLTLLFASSGCAEGSCDILAIPARAILPITVLSVTSYGLSVNDFRKSVRIYNKNLTANNVGHQSFEIDFRVTGNGIGLVFNF